MLGSWVRAPCGSQRKGLYFGKVLFLFLHIEERKVFFRQLPLNTQLKILDEYGADNPQELGLDKEPYATIIIDDCGVAAMELTRIKLKTA